MATLTEPLRFERHILEKVWGGRSLERSLGIPLPPGMPVGETWEVVDRGEESSMVAVGELQGITLGQLMEIHGAELLGDAPVGREGRFPLLVKFIDAARNLSVQVHPDEAAAQELGGDVEAKTEAWYVVDVAPSGAIYAGLRPGITREEFAAIADGPDVEQALLRWDVRPGDCMLVPGGTVHAIGAGVTILEVQQNSDTTYRLYDWGRLGLDGTPRELHVDRALSCVRFDREATGPVSPTWQDAAPGLHVAAMVRSPHFTMDGLRIALPTNFDTEESFRLLAVIEGGGEIVVSANGKRHSLVRGDVWLLPAACGEYVIEPSRGELSIVQMTRGT